MYDIGIDAVIEQAARVALDAPARGPRRTTHKLYRQSRYRSRSFHRISVKSWFSAA
jgi:hypothetical protein